MTYQQALNLKENVYGNIIFDGNIPNHVIIVPSLKKEWANLINHIQHDFSLYNDELCLQFCSNDDYELRAIVTEEGKEIIKSIELRNF